MHSAIRTVLLALSLTTTEAAAGQIDLTMTGFPSDAGMARIVLMEGIDGFTGAKPVFLTASVPISEGQASWIGDVPAGTYAIIAHHDRNTNDDLDRPAFALPLEPYGYSNGAWTNMGLPAFNEVAFYVGDGVAPQRVHMRTNAFVTLAQIIAAGAASIAVLFTLIAVRRRRVVRLT